MGSVDEEVVVFSAQQQKQCPLRTYCHVRVEPLLWHTAPTEFFRLKCDASLPCADMPVPFMRTHWI